jgi:hypothetical protein
MKEFHNVQTQHERYISDTGKLLLINSIVLVGNSGNVGPKKLSNPLSIDVEICLCFLFGDMVVVVSKESRRTPAGVFGRSMVSDTVAFLLLLSVIATGAIEMVLEESRSNVIVVVDDVADADGTSGVVMDGSALSLVISTRFISVSPLLSIGENPIRPFAGGPSNAGLG